MIVTLRLEVADEFLEERARDFKEETGVTTTARAYFRARAEEVAGDELPLAFFGWPLQVTVEGP